MYSKYTICLLLISIAFTSFSQDVMFWGDQKSNTLNKLDINSGEVSVIAENQHVIRRIKVDQQDQKVYWTEAQQGGVFRANFDGSEQEKVVASNFSISILVLDEVHKEIYFTEYGAIKKCNYDGSNVQLLIKNNGLILGMAIDLASNSIYYTDSQNKLLNRASLDGSNIATIFESQNILYDLVLSPKDEHIYFSDRTESKIHRIDYSGANLTEIMQVEGSIGSLGIDHYNQKLTWIEKGNGIVGITNLKGEEKAELLNIPVSIITGQDIVLEKRVQPTPQATGTEMEFLVFPNPASTFVNIQTSMPPAEMKIVVYDYLGSLVYDKELESDHNTIDCSQLSSGVYLFCLKDNNHVTIQTKEVVIVRKD